MFLKKAIPISLAVTALLAIFMLQMGSDNESTWGLPLISVLLIPLGVTLVDFKRLFSLPEWGANILILLVVLAQIGKIIQAPTEFLAYSIANILVYVQVILFYRRKEVMIDYQILILAFIEGGVACVFQQNPLFAVLLLAFSFAFLTSLSLLFLNQERYYYQNHAFLRSVFDQGEKVKRVTVGHLLALAVKTVFITPLVLFLGYRWKEWSEEEGDQPNLLIHDHKSEAGEKGPAAPKGDWFARLKVRFFKAPPEKGETLDSDAKGAETEKPTSRWPLLRTVPLFSGTNLTSAEPTVGRPFFSRLFAGTTVSLLAACVIFLFFPRLQSMEIGSVQIGHDRWVGGETSVRSVTGFNEKMKLGEIGPAGDLFQTVMKVRFYDVSGVTANPVAMGEPIWMRGSVLARYENREWFQPRNESILPPEEDGYRRIGGRTSERRNGPTPQKMPGYVFSGEGNDYSRAIFDDQNPIVCQEIQLYPLSTRAIFAVWPFFQWRQGAGFIVGERFLRPLQAADREIFLNLLTNAFQNGQQMDLIPANKRMSETARREYLEIDLKRLPKLAALAREWDAEANLPKTDYRGRAKNLENRLRNSGEFTYERYGVPRDASLDPLEDFVSLHRSGHCEYFAGGLAMMLRAIGIPSRVVLGFCFQNGADENGVTVVRQSDAHSWVEAFIPPEAIPPEEASRSLWWEDGGWLRLDATPEAETEILREVSIRYQSARESITDFWNHYILNYNEYSQRRNIYHPFAVAAASVWNTVAEKFNAWNPFYKPTGLEDEDSPETPAEKRARTAARWPFYIAASALLGAVILVGWRIIRRRRKKAASILAEDLAADLWGRLEKLLAHYGVVRRANETPREYIRRFLDSSASAALNDLTAAQTEGGADDSAIPSVLGPLGTLPKEILEAFVAIYYRVRYGQRDFLASERESIVQFLNAMEKEPKGTAI